MTEASQPEVRVVVVEMSTAAAPPASVSLSSATATTMTTTTSPDSEPGTPSASANKCAICLGDDEGVQWRRDDFACACADCRFHDACWAQYTARATRARPTTCPICRRPLAAPPSRYRDDPAAVAVAAAAELRGVTALALRALVPHGTALCTAASMALLVAAALRSPLDAAFLFAYALASAAVILSEYGYQFAYAVMDRTAPVPVHWAHQIEREFALSWHATVMAVVRVAWVVYALLVYLAGGFKGAPLLGIMTAVIAARMLLWLAAFVVVYFHRLARDARRP